MSRTIKSALLLGSNVVRNTRTKEAVIRSLSTTQLSHQWSSPSCAATQLINLQANHGRPRHAISHITNFSTAAMMPQTNDDQQSSSSTSSSTKQQRPKRTRRSLDPLLITPAAAARIHFVISQHNLNNPGSPEGPAVGIRLGTKKRGCNGLSYTLNYAYENHLENHPRDEAMTINLSSPDMEGNGLKVFVEPMALMNVIGTEMDFLDTVMTSEFTFTNPNSKGECGCGESFNV
ncbi:iron-sulfur cluster assembly protein [Skeletonema marinoi]|uniref:Iron-sulfur cluster assembly protein n=1 Tax=Skeletonema marinoi TaxID=267567 RepID=A0AAD8YCN3_9STRA|nr:iron-sulfur cluster assembly protein [Skeletonema marinoi]|mmetsp:Transcript_26327/g.44808  ORF Transcript_26327/g.44808 Transcript_26327/m.44808 type:complete len:233 (-) Transcript_26327:1459-2157(-)